MSTPVLPDVPAVVDVEREVELSYAHYALDLLFGHRKEEEKRHTAPSTDPPLFGDDADRRALRAAMRRLPPTERRVVRMRLSGYESSDTVAVALGLPQSSVAGLLEKGLSRILRDLLT